MNTYTVTVNESDRGVLSVANVTRTVAVNQHKSLEKRMPKTTFAFAGASDPASLTKRASKRSR